MRYRVTVTEKTVKYIIVAATSIEEANIFGLVRAKNFDPDMRGPTEVASFRIADDKAKVT